MKARFGPVLVIVMLCLGAGLFFAAAQEEPPPPPGLPPGFPGQARLPMASKQIYSVLLELLKDEDVEVRTSVAEALAHFGSEVVPALVEMLKSKEKLERVMAAQVLGQIGFHAQEALPELLKLLKNKDEDKELRRAVAKAVSKIVKNPYGDMGMAPFGVMPPGIRFPVPPAIPNVPRPNR